MGQPDFDEILSRWGGPVALLLFATGVARGLLASSGLGSAAVTGVIHVVVGYFVFGFGYIAWEVINGVSGKTLRNPEVGPYRKLAAVLWPIVLLLAGIDIVALGGAYIVRPFFLLLSGQWDQSYWGCSTWEWIYYDDVEGFSQSEGICR